MQAEQPLNLSRKLRSRQFEQLVGQDLVVAMLKNSLYLDHFFPVYLFSGNRGCGKTSTARIFAAAVNCDQLLYFQKNPKIIVPCLECQSCVSLYQGRHPDFVEVDAASHTGVDNIRDLIESSVLLPIMGRKKVYLIDEVHMLSKAACNALLKILEEPPSTALFLLATTDPQKLIDTVRSRCFQLFFSPVATPVLSDYLAQVCIQEGIAYEEAGLVRIVDESGGCVRDALNMIEQIRFSHARITCDAVTSVLGYISDTVLIDTIVILFSGNISALLDHIAAKNMPSFSTEYTWRRLTELIRAMMWLNYGVNPPHIMVTSELQNASECVSLAFLQRFLDQLYVHYDSFMRSTAHYTWLEALLLRVCHTSVVDGNQNIIVSVPESYVEKKSIEPDNLISAAEKKWSCNDSWAQFLELVSGLEDQMIGSLFNQGVYGGYDTESHVLSIRFPADRLFFKELLEGTKELWLSLLQKIYGSRVILDYQFQEEKVARPEKKGAPPVEKVAKQPVVTHSNTKHTVDLSELVIAPMLLEQFPGTIREVIED